MFVGRERELSELDRLASRDTFQMAVVYGRRRVGKTALISKFVENRPCLFYTAQQKSDALNLRVFSRDVYRFFGLPEDAGAFQDWSAGLSFVAQRARELPGFVFVFDEFPYAAQANPSLPSALQIAIDHGFQETGTFLILCGSNEGFMESEVLGAKSPLYGRRTAQLKLGPLGYRDAANLVPSDDVEELITYYAVFGGTPYYLRQIDPAASFVENMARQFFSISGVLYAEPQMLLRQELRDPALYSSVLDAIGSGETTPKRIAERAGVEENSVGSYLKILMDLGIAERVLPFDAPARGSRKSIYRIADPFFAFWYRFVSPQVDMIEAGLGEIAAQFAEGETLTTYVGRQFESVCLQWLVEQAREQRLPFVPMKFGTWWGPDPVVREQTDIDVVVANRREGKVLAGECKWRNSFDETEALRALEHRASLLTDYSDRYLVLFSKRAVSEGTREKVAADERLTLVTAQDLYRV